jgi:hypothetical protein
MNNQPQHRFTVPVVALHESVRARITEIFRPGALVGHNQPVGLTCR